MKKILFVLVLCLLFVGCAKVEEFDLDKIISEDNYIILDVRTKEEYDELHVVDAINIPYDEIEEDINLDKDKVILVYCRSGSRSAIAYDILEELGYKVYDLGGISSVDLPKE